MTNVIVIIVRNAAIMSTIVLAKDAKDAVIEYLIANAKKKFQYIRQAQQQTTKKEVNEYGMGKIRNE